jgi:hypothetical protein
MNSQEKRPRDGASPATPKQPGTARALRQRAESVFLKNTAK